LNKFPLDDSISLLNNFNLVCSPGYALQKFQIYYSYNTYNLSFNAYLIRFYYRCVKANMTNCVLNTKTTQTDCGGAYSEKNSALYLAAQTAFVSEDRVLTRFKVDTTDDSLPTNACMVNYQYDHCQIVPCDNSCR